MDLESTKPVGFLNRRVFSTEDTMHATADQELLRRYAEHGAEEAFAALVHRHLNLVWAAARRTTGDADLARDVAQTVFTDLARKAKTLPRETMLAGWLYRAACLAAAKQVRGEARRVLREHHAMAMLVSSSTESAATRAAEELQPVLDAALAEIPDADRDAVVLRFLAGRSLAEVGAAFGTGEDAAQKRVSRALEKLREAFRRRGVDVGGGMVAAALGVAGAPAAPPGLAGTVAAGAITAAGTAGAGAPLALLMKSKLTLGIVGGAAWPSARKRAQLRRRIPPGPMPAGAIPRFSTSCENSRTNSCDCAANWPNFGGPRKRRGTGRRDHRKPGLLPRWSQRTWLKPCSWPMPWPFGPSTHRST